MLTHARPLPVVRFPAHCPRCARVTAHKRGAASIPGEVICCACGTGRDARNGG